MNGGRIVIALFSAWDIRSDAGERVFDSIVREVEATGYSTQLPDSRCGMSEPPVPLSDGVDDGLEDGFAHLI